MRYAGDAQVYLFCSYRSALINKPKEISEPPACGSLRDHTEPNLVADQDHGFGQGICALDEALELLLRLILFSTAHPGRHPQGKRVEQHCIPSGRHLENRVQASARQLQHAPTGVTSLAMGLNAP